MKEYMKLLLAFILCLPLLGCLTLEQSLNFNRDGSAVMTYSYKYRTEQEEALAAAVTKISEYVKKTDPDSKLFLGFLDEKETTDFYNSQGTEVRRYKKSAAGGFTTVAVTILARDGFTGVNSGIFGQHRVSRNGNNTRWESAIPRGEYEPVFRERLEKLCPDMSAVFTVSAPSRIKSSNAAEVTGNTAVWHLPLTGEKGKCLLEPPQLMYAEW